MTTLLVIPADPISAYVRKGEIKGRYWNPNDVFEEIHVVSADTGPVDDTALRRMAGDARVVLHAMGPWRPLSLGSSPYWGRYPRRVAEIARSVRPDVVRAFSPIETGWLARAAARATGVPYVISVHGNYDLDYRARALARRRWRGVTYLWLTRMLVERPVLRGASLVICAYEFAAAYVRRFRRDGVEVVYNRVDLTRFRPADRTGAFTVLFVGRCEENKGQDVLIDAMRWVDGRLILVGDGPTRPDLERRARDRGVDGRVAFVPAVPHADLPAVFARASCYASAILYGGIQIPHLEAMASGLPLVVARPLWEAAPEQMGDVALVPERDPRAMADAIERIRTDRAVADDLATRSLRRAGELDGRRTEARERDLYARVLAEGRGR